jgi:miniconductance mechanosensitive channel
MNYIENFLKTRNVDETVVGYLSYILMVLVILFICILANLIVKKVILSILSKVIRNNRYHWDNIMLDRKVFHRIANVIPAVIVYMFAPAFPNIVYLIHLGASTYILIAAVFVINSLLDSINDIYRIYPISKIRPIKGLLQVVKISVYIIIGIVAFANLMGENPLTLLGGIGALAAVFSFVFKDSILGFIAGIQLTSNDMLRIGDWIEMTKYGADGDVVDITLNTVKVQNFDKTIVSIPAYALVSDSFKNWRGMTEFGGRRIKRSFYIDMNSISFCTPEMIEKFKKITFLRDYIIEKENEIKEYNLKYNTSDDMLINGRHMTNIGTFRAYIQCYLKNKNELHKGMVQMVRQLPATENGLPLEIYAFTDDTKWEIYEEIQSDIFDHIFSVVEEFGLRIFQNPTGYDMQQINLYKGD